MYYGFSNFYQNHRRYVKSRDDSQLNGDKTSLLVCTVGCLLRFVVLVLMANVSQGDCRFRFFSSKLTRVGK